MKGRRGISPAACIGRGCQRAFFPGTVATAACGPAAQGEADALPEGRRTQVQRIRWAHACALVMVSAVSVWVQDGFATTVAEVPFEAQSRTADRVFVGTVTAVESRHNPVAPRYFETRVELHVEEPVAGGVPERVSLRLSGGQIGNIKQAIDDMPEFRVGERYVVFLEQDREPRLISPIVGFNQGLYRVVRDGDRSVVRDRRGHPLAPAQSAAVSRALTGRADAVGEPDVESFVAAVRAARP